MSGKGFNTDIQQIKTDEICDNLNEKIIAITESKARLVYQKYTGIPTAGAMLSDFGLLVAFATPLITSDFNGILGFSPEVLKACFIVASIVFACKFIGSTFRYITKGRRMNEESFLKELKGQTEEKKLS